MEQVPQPTISIRSVLVIAINSSFCQKFYEA